MTTRTDPMTCQLCERNAAAAIDHAATKVDRDQWRRLALALQQAHPKADDLDPFLWRIWMDKANRETHRKEVLGARLAIAERALRTGDPKHVREWKRLPPLESED